MKKIDMDNLIKNRNNYLLLIIFILTIFMTVGYAKYGEMLKFNGGISVLPDGKFEITRVTLNSSSNVSTSEPPVINSKSLNFNITFAGTAPEFYAIYDVELSNNSSYDYIYNGFNVTPKIAASGNATAKVETQITGINYGDKIPAKSKKNITIKLILLPDAKDQTYTADILLDTSINANKGGQILISCNPKSIDLRGTKDKEMIEIELINTYVHEVKVIPSSSNTNFEIVDSNGNLINEIVLQSNSTTKHNIYIKRKSTAKFYDNQTKTKIILTGININNTYSDDITVLVDKEELVDKKIPQIGPIKWEIRNNKGAARVTWTRLDTNGTAIKRFTIVLYDAKTNAVVKTYNTKNETYSYIMKNISPGSYYVKIYGTDTLGNTGAPYLDTATETSVHCRKSPTIELKWIFNVTNNVTNLTFSGASTVNRGATYSATIAPKNGGFALPDKITVNMNNQLLDTTQYTYNVNDGSISIPNVTGDINITATAINSCLIEGTLVTLANGKQKKIENITYNDLLLVWSYDLGKFVYEYPIWIEKEAKTTSYQRITFSDKSTLDTLGFHGIFNIEQNRFVSVDDYDNFNIGTKVYKLENKKLKPVTVQKLETINETKNYYHIVSTRYQNIIANNILTTDGTTILSNVYGFEDNIKWPNSRNKMLQNKNNLFKYQEFKSFMPNYMFKGMRMEEAKILNNLNYIKRDDFIKYVKNNQVNDKMWLKPNTNINDMREWMVTTSDDSINDINSKIFLKEEGSFYKVPMPKQKQNFLYWYNSGDNKKYYPGDIITVFHGTHFEAIYKK